MEFEFNDQKNESNLSKHKIDFLTAQRLWNGLDRVEIPAQTVEEQRFLVIGQVDGKLWSAVITRREDKV
jgi:uncharacterized protein